MKLSDFSGKSNNLNFLKFIASVMVIYAHSFVVTGTAVRPLVLPIFHTGDWGGLGVSFFFFVSGFSDPAAAYAKRPVNKAFCVRKGQGKE